MIPGVPCQPLAVALALKLKWGALPILIAGQTTAGVLAFHVSRRASDSELLNGKLESLPPDMRERFEKFRTLGKNSSNLKVFAALIGLRLAPFFPFSAGNYLLGAGTQVSLLPFTLATVCGCITSNTISVGVGVGAFTALIPPPS